MQEVEQISECVLCRTSLPISAFKHFTASGRNKVPRREKLCRKCSNERARSYPKKKTKAEQAASRRATRYKNKQEAVALMGGKCYACKLEFPFCAFDFHHRDPTQKDIDPGLMLGGLKEKLFKELEKCDLLCANCHRIHHFNNGY